HYARIDTDPEGAPRLLQGKDQGKDQSYVLWAIPRQTLGRTLFPVGQMTKPQVRQTARDHHLATAEAPDSQEICFVADGDYRRFLRENAADRLAAVGSGEIVNEEGSVVGNHDGYPDFTLGQRRGLGLSNPEPLYVKALDPAENRITVAPRAALFGRHCHVGQLNWLVEPPSSAIQVVGRVRYNGSGAPARLVPNGASTVHLEFDEPQLAITPGQSAVFYDGQVLMGGGVIQAEGDG
ncbi:MAG: aminomethyltransferase beta-barrel domain-containing protein, partial [Candidatus Neomarinimicrobiota bacterium]